MSNHWVVYLKLMNYMSTLIDEYENSFKIKESLLFCMYACTPQTEKFYWR